MNNSPVGFSLTGVFVQFVLLTWSWYMKQKLLIGCDDKEHAMISEPFPELYFWICTQGIKVQQKIQNNVLTKEKKTTQCLCTILINNKDSFLNISHSEVFDCLYFWIYIFKFCRFLFTKVFLFSSKDSSFLFQNHNCYNFFFPF